MMGEEPWKYTHVQYMEVHSNQALKVLFLTIHNFKKFREKERLRIFPSHFLASRTNMATLLHSSATQFQTGKYIRKNELLLISTYIETDVDPWWLHQTIHRIH